MLQIIQLRLAEDVEQLLSQLAEQRGKSVEQLITQAIANELFFAEQRAQGARVLIQRPDRTFLEVQPNQTVAPTSSSSSSFSRLYESLTKRK